VSKGVKTHEKNCGLGLTTYLETWWVYGDYQFGTVAKIFENLSGEKAEVIMGNSL